MPNHYIKKLSTLNISINNYFDYFKLQIISLSQKQWDSEDLKGVSNSQWSLMQYYNFLYLLIIIYREKQRLPNKDWSYFVTKYNLVNIEKCIRCEGIDYNKALSIFGFETTTNGIENISIEDSFSIESGEVENTKPKIDVLIFLNTPNYCINNIK